MCGRYVVFSENEFDEIQRIVDVVSEIYKAENVAKGEVFPTNLAPVIYEENGKRILGAMKWSYGDISGKPIINTRAETILEKPFFQHSFSKRRCLIPAKVYFEWKQEMGLKKKTKYAISLEQLAVFFMAGIYHTFKDKSGTPYTGFSIITTHANEVAARVHHRMPVILTSGTEDFWLSQSHENTDALK